MKALGIDIGGSSLKGAVVDCATGRLAGERVVVPTPDSPTPAAVATAAAELARRCGWSGPAGIGFPGVVQGGRIRTAANLGAAWVGVDGVKLFGRALGCPVGLVNDADAAGLAEARFGAGRGFRGSILVVTLGTGIGSALIHDGRLFPNSELGHVPWRGRSAEKWAAAAAKTRRGLDWKDWAARVHDYLQLVEKFLWPDRIIIGGGVSADHAKFFPHVQTRAELRPARLRNDAGIVGAALVAPVAGAAGGGLRPAGSGAGRARRRRPAG